MEQDHVCNIHNSASYAWTCWESFGETTCFPSFHCMLFISTSHLHNCLCSTVVRFNFRIPLINNKWYLCKWHLFHLRSVNTNFVTYLSMFCINIFQVTGGSGRLYTCFLSCHYCPCPAFAYSVLRRNDGLVVSLIQTICRVALKVFSWVDVGSGERISFKYKCYTNVSVYLPMIVLKRKKKSWLKCIFFL